MYIDTSGRNAWLIGYMGVESSAVLQYVGQGNQASAIIITGKQQYCKTARACWERKSSASYMGMGLQVTLEYLHICILFLIEWQEVPYITS